MTFDQLFRIFKARWVLALSVVMTLVVITLVISLLIPKSYKATASVMIDMKPDPVAGMSAAMSSPPASLMATQVDIITSPSVAARVVRQMGMADTPDAKRQWMAATGGKGDYQAWVGTLIGQGLDVKPSRESNVIEVTYSSVDPKFAAGMANAFVKAYMDSTVQIRVDPARQYYSFFEERARLAREKLEAAQNRLAQAQKEKDIVVTDERLDSENARLNDLSAQVVALRSLKADTSSKSSAAERNPDQMQEVLNNSLIGSLKADLAREEAKLEELTSRYGDAHPLVIEARANITGTRDRINAETRKLTKSLGITNNLTTSRQSEALTAYQEQREKLLKLKDVRNELAVLEREVDSAQKVYDAIQARQSQMGLESNNNQNSIVLLSSATEPSSHYFPKLTLNLLLAVSLGTLISVIVVLGVEMFDRRIRGAQDLIQGTGLPILGILPNPTSSKWGSRLRLGSNRGAGSTTISIGQSTGGALEATRGIA